MFKLNDYTRQTEELELLNGDVIHVKAILKKDVDKFNNILSRISGADSKDLENIEERNREMDEALLKIINNNEEKKVLDKEFLDNLEMGHYTALIKFIGVLIKDAEKKHPSQSQIMK